MRQAVTGNTAAPQQSPPTTATFQGRLLPQVKPRLAAAVPGVMLLPTLIRLNAEPIDCHTRRGIGSAFVSALVGMRGTRERLVWRR
jgi:hypothetical protein